MISFSLFIKSRVHMYIDIQQIPRYEMLEVIICVWQEAMDSHAVSNDILVSKKLITNSKI